MEEDWFWEVVTDANWPLHQHGTTEDGVVFMAARLGPEEVQRFLKMVQQKADVLLAELDAQEAATGYRLRLRDDFRDDLAAHIIGLGRDEYRRALREPHRILERGQCQDYVESFLYMFPLYADDGSVSGFQVQNFARRAGEIGRSYHMLRGAQLRFVMPWVIEILRILEQMEAGHWQTFLDNEDRCRRMAADVTDYVDHIIRNKPAPLPVGGAAEPERELRALYRDARRWLVDFPRLRQELRPDDA